LLFAHNNADNFRDVPDFSVAYTTSILFFNTDTGGGLKCFPVYA